MEETQVLNTEQVPTGGNDSKVAAERVKQLHDALIADEVMKDYVPNDFRRFVEVYKDPKNMNSLYDALSADDVFKDYIPDSKERMYDLYVLGKQKSEPAKEPSQSSVLQSPSNGGVEFGLNQTISAESNQPNVMAEPQPLSPQVEPEPIETPTISQEEIVPKPPEPQVIAPFQGLKESAESLPKKEKVGEERYPEMIANLRNEQNQLLPQYNDLEKMVTQQAAELEQNKAEVEAQLQDPNTPDELKVQLQQQYEASIGNYEQAVNQLQQLGEQVNKNQRAINVLDKGYKRKGGQYEKEMEIIFDKQPFLDKATGIYNEFSTSVYNTVVPSVVSTVGALLKSPMLNPLAGTPANILNEMAGDELLKLSDKLVVDADKLNAASGVMPTSKKAETRIYDEINPYNFARGMGNLAGSIGMTMAGGGIAGKIGGQAAAFSQIYGNSYKDGIKAGLDNNQATMYASAIAAPAAILEEFGVSKLFDLAVSKGGKKILQEAILTELKKNGGKMTAKEIFDFTTKKVTQIVSSGVVEGGVEVSQGAAEFLTKLGTEAITDVDFEGNLDIDEFKKQAYENFTMGVAGGGAAAIGIQTSPETINQVAAEALISPEKMQDFKNNLESLRINGDITPEGFNAANTALNNAINVSKTVPATITNVDERKAAIDLIQKRDELTKQFETTDPDLAAPVKEQLDAVKKDLQNLAKGEYISENKTYNVYVSDINDIPQEYRDSAVKLGEDKTRKSFLGIPYGKETVTNRYRYTIEGKDAKSEIDKLKEDSNIIEEEVIAETQPTTEEAQAPQETEQATKLGIDSFSDEANDFISREKEDLKRDVDYFKKEVEERKPKTTLGKLNDKFDRVVMRYKPYVEVELEIIQKKLDLLEKNPLEYYKNEIDETIKDDDSDSERKDRNIKYYQEIIDYLEQERITPTTETKTTENAIQEQPTTQEVPRPGEGGQNIPEGGQGVRPSEQGQETAQQGKEEVISEPTIDQQFQDVKDKNFVTFNYKNESEVPDILKGKISSKGENNGVPFVKVTLPKSLADYYLQTQKLKQDEKTEKGPMLEGLQATGDEGKGGQAGAELRTEAKGKKEIEELAEPIVIFKGNTGKLNPDGSRRTAHPNIKGVFGSTDLKSAERYGNDISKFDIPKGTTVETVEIKNKKIPLSEARKQETELVNASDAQIVRLITYDAKGREVQYIIKDKSILQQNKPIKNAEEVLTIKQQIENFGVAPEMVEPVNGVISQVFESLKKAGLTAAKNVGEWIGIGKGKEKSYSLKINGNDVQVKNVQPEVVNGFYSPLEKIINEAKQDKMPAKQWADKYANSEEAKWTGLKDWLSQQQGSVSKADIQQYLKDNRISVVEVVKGGGRPEQSIINDIEKEGYTLEGSLGEEGYVIMDKEGEMAEYDELPDNVRKLYDELSTVTISDASGTKFSQYQLEGEKSNYKEVLVTLPNRTPLTFEEFKARAQKETSMDDYEVKAAYKNYIAKGDFSKLAPNQFKSSHFDEPNILVHLRMNTRTDAEGNKVLFLEEVQSDWGQQGKKEGFSKNIKELPSDYKIKSRRLYNKDNTFSEYFEVINPQGKLIANADTEIEAKEKALRMLNRIGTPTAPFVMDTNAWTKLGLKVALKEAVAQGADKIAWTTGEQQNERYDLRKQVDEIYYSKTKDGAYRVWAKKDGNIIFKENSMQEKELEQNFGKDVAEKIINDKGQSQEGLAGKKLSGNDLAVGGKGMKGFYGSPTEGTLGIVGNVAKSLFKQEVGTVEIQTEVKIDGGELKSKDQNYKINDLGEGDFELIYKNKNLGSRFGLESVKELANEHRQQNLGLEGDVEWGGKNVKATQYSIDITPELRASVEDGQPLFKDAQAQYRIENGQNVIEAIKDFDGSPEAVVALTHEIMHPTVVAIIDGAAEGNEVGTRHTQTIVDEFNKANPKSKVTVDELIAGNNAFREGTTSEQYRDVQEFIAESWEKYHTEGGKGFSEAFQKVLEQITEAFRAVYKTLTGKQLTPELRQMFDEILGKEAAKVETDAFADLANQFGEAAKEAVKAEVVTAETFADISQTGKAGRDARESARKKFGKDAVAKMEEISRNFDKLIEQLESENKVRKECP